MKRNRWTSRSAWSIAGVTVAVMVFILTESALRRQAIADDAVSSTAPASISDPNHLWNRIRHRFHVRLESEIAQAPENLPFNQNEHDPMLWLRVSFPKPADYLLKGLPHQESIALLDEFLIQHGEKLESDPLQRALLQHDLWAVFDFVSDPDWPQNPRRGRGAEWKPYRQQRRELYQRLAKAIDRLALTNDQIAKLPDNYAAAVSAGRYPAKFDPRHPGQAFLPSDLWEEKGPWVLVGEWSSDPLAIRHATFFGGRSTFSVFYRLPQGRAATLSYLEKLRAWKEKKEPTAPPQIPPQTQLALARRMMVVNSAGELVPTRLLEQLQIRVLPDPDKPDELPTFLEYRLRRQDLFDAKAGGLSLVEKDELDREDVVFLSTGPLDEKRTLIMDSCRHCHHGQGILTVNSFTGGFGEVSVSRSRFVTDQSEKEQNNRTIAWKQKQYSWGLLTGLNEQSGGTER